MEIRPRRLVALAAMATGGYLFAFTSGAVGLVFFALFLIGVAGEVGFWVELLHSWRQRTDS